MKRSLLALGLWLGSTAFASAQCIAVGGVNIDTGVPNTIVYKAPAGATTVSPLTTLIQAYAETKQFKFVIHQIG